MSDEQTNTLARLEALVDEIESELAGGASDSPKSDDADITDSPHSHVRETDIKSDNVIDIAQHPLGRRSWLPDAVLNDADSRFAGLTDEIWDKLTEELHQVKPVSDIQPASDMTLSAEGTVSDGTDNTGTPSDLPAEHTSAAAETKCDLKMPADPDAQKLADIQQRIDRYWEKHTVKTGSMGKSLGVVLSLGFIMAAVLYGAYLIGMELVRRSGQGWLLPLCLIVGMAAGFYLGFTLLYPLIKHSAKEQPAAKAAQAAREKKR